MSQLYNTDSMASLSNADCGSGCCANPTGICSGPGASTQNGKTGCGFGSGGSSSAAPSAPSCCSSRSSRYSFSRRPGIRPSRSKKRWKRSGNTIHWRPGEEDISLFHITSFHFHSPEISFMLPALSHLHSPPRNILLTLRSACLELIALLPAAQVLPEYAVDLEPRHKPERPDADSFPARLRMQLQQRQSLHPSLLPAQHLLRKLVDRHLTLLVLRT